MLAHLILKDGECFRGDAPLGKGGSGEVVFTTAMAGYQEILTDPSFAGQMVCMTFPEQGVYGVHADLGEASRPWAAGFVCRRLSLHPDHTRAEGDLGSWLKRHRIPVITDVDTRALTQHVRDRGAQPGLIWTEADGSLAAGVAAASHLPDMSGQALAGEVSCDDRYEILRPGARFRVAVLDGGIKASILTQLSASGLDLEVFPWDAPASELTAARFHGLFLSNGPGDPAALPGMRREVEACIGRLPIFGICLGHQLLGQAFGGSTFKLKFGHRGANQPVLDLATRRIEITAQNHGFAVDEASLPPEIQVTHRHLSDDTVEGLRHRTLPIFSIQHHPEASPGPHDARGAFGRFIRMMEDHHA
ncbi:glutamine-hydrolyzing carbamoyl-phosphate synthase small subunit [Mesoterricola silvestris]|uniref:Carbamoyl phosphate synthase small chain n=1 Tax=Mesoterricola silvestris TaxID=2927979 RepID=A0AA48GQI0_9BACT|nr:glutamine-hydrolyzing carbamoyl-phosphate synthase small subunit [Mesoterricola silvestris]BDU73855.1 carbamoyl-phosphate synthase small chain [Mesoterricola silvestris]